jgi:DNA-binding GntR family transcriptional regulator
LLNVEFHETMVSLVGNKKLFSIYRRLTRELGLFRRRNLTQDALLQASIQEHRDILAAIRSRDPLKASDALRQHVLLSRERTERTHPQNPISKVI